MNKPKVFVLFSQLYTLTFLFIVYIHNNGLLHIANQDAQQARSGKPQSCAIYFPKLASSSLKSSRSLAKRPCASSFVIP